MTLSVIPLISGGYLVKGTDHEGNKGSTVLYSEKWDALVAVRAHSKAMKKFDKRTLKFFKPLTDAAAEVHKATAKANGWGTVVVEKGVEGKQAHVIELDEDGTILRILAEGNQNLLLWVGTDRLVAIEA